MKLHWSPRSPFVRKLMICSHEIGVAERMTCVRSPVEMTTPNADVLRDNPLGKIPALVLDDGAVLYDSRVICEYLDTLHNGARMFPTHSAQRWIALRRQALGDGMLDALLIWRFERAKPENMRMQELMAAYALKINTALAALEAEAGALAAQAARGLPFVFEVRDLWPELPRALGLRNPLLLGGMEVLETAAYRAADAVVGLSPGIVRGIRRKSSPRQRVVMIPNGSDLEVFHPRLRRAGALPGFGPDDFLAGFTGAHGPANGLDALLDVARELRRRGDRRVKLVFIGDGKEKERLAAQAAAEGLDHCRFFPPIPKTELGAVTASLDCGLMVLRDVPAFYDGTSPNKFFDYAAAGIPVVNNYPGWLAGLIADHDAGSVVPPADPVAFADALQALAADPARRARQGAAARRLAETRFARADLAADFVATLEAAAG